MMPQDNNSNLTSLRDCGPKRRVNQSESLVYRTRDLTHTDSRRQHRTVKFRKNYIKIEQLNETKKQTKTKTGKRKNM